MAVEFKDYYKILGVDRKADEKTIKSAYRRLARKYHPDVNKGKDAADRFKEINEANEVLSDPEKRQRYDNLGPDWQRYAQQRPGGPGPQGSGFRVEYGDLGDFSDFFQTLFGDLGARAGRGGRGSGAREGVGFDVEDLLGGARAGARTRARGGGVQPTEEIKVDEELHGARRSVTMHVDEPCPAAPGLPRRRQRQRPTLSHVPWSRLAAGRALPRREDPGRRAHRPTGARLRRRDGRTRRARRSLPDRHRDARSTLRAEGRRTHLR